MQWIWIVWAILLVGLTCGCAGTEPRVLGDVGTSFEQMWHLEGTGSATYDQGTLTLQEDSDGVGVVAWLKEDHPSDFDLRFELAFSNNRCIGVIFFATTGPNGIDLFDAPPRTGAYDEYIRGDVNGYSLSLHRYWPDGRNNPGSNLRRNSGFHLLSQALPDPALDAKRPYAVAISKRGPHLTVLVDGQLVHEATDDGTYGRPWGSGKLGFRLRGHESCVMTVNAIALNELAE